MELIIKNVLNMDADEFYRASRYKLLLSVVAINSNYTKAYDIMEKNTQ